MKAKDVLQLEKDLSFHSFTNEDAYHIAASIIHRVKKDKLKNIRIRVVLHNEIVFQYLMDGKTGDLWLNRKQKTIERFQHSGYYLFLEDQENGTYKKYHNDESIVLCGGSFPIIVEDKVIGCFIVSGLSHEQDHQLIVDAFYTYQNRNALASDIDGTLYFPDLDTSYKPGDLKAIKAFQEMGHFFGVCTGRPFYAILNMHKDLNIDFYIVSSGALILNHALEIIEEYPIDFEICQKLYNEYTSQVQIIIHTLNTHGIYKNFEDESYPGLLFHDFEELKKEKIYSLSFVVDTEETAKLIKKELDIHYPELEGFQNKNAIDIVKKGCSKGISTKKIKQWLKVKQISGIGDSYNDIPLLDSSDIGFTFYDSPQILKDKSTYVVDSIEQAIHILTEDTV